MERFPYGGTNRVRPDAIAAYLAGVLAAYMIAQYLRGGAILTTLIIVAVGGLWYHWRRIT